MSAAAPALELRGITKRFGPVVANDGIDFDLRPGEVHALLGENGAGKSTLMSILYGLYHPDEGEIRVNGEPVAVDSPSKAIELGIGMVHQHFMLVPVMTVTENIVLGGEPRRRGGLLDVREGARRVRELSERYGLAVDPDAVIEDVTVGAQQRVEILKTLYRDARILVLDEPTAVLTAQETAELFEVLRALRDDGVAIVFISHKLGEVLEIADRVTVLRRGKKVDTVPTAGATEQSLARLMVGRDVLLRVDKPDSELGAPVLEVEDLRVRDDRDLEAVRGLSLTVRAGEIVALAGVDGNGQHELVEAIAGLRDADAGEHLGRGRGGLRPRRAGDLRCRRRPHPRGPPAARARARLHAGREPGPARVPLAAAVARGLAQHRPHQRARPALLSRVRRARGRRRSALAASLSGGNQQKVCIAREIASDPQLLIAHQPTRGLDVGAIEFVHRRLVAERDKGRGVLLVSLESEEVRSLADRILVIYEGQIVGEFPPEASEEELGFAMTGGKGRTAA